MPPKTITCPDCGLVLRVLPDATSTTVTYDINDWQRRCTRLDIESPSQCLLLRERINPRKE
jgi:hypothetical protein